MMLASVPPQTPLPRRALTPPPRGRELDRPSIFLALQPRRRMLVTRRLPLRYAGERTDVDPPTTVPVTTSAHACTSYGPAATKYFARPVSASSQSGACCHVSKSPAQPRDIFPAAFAKFCPDRSRSR